MARFYFPASRQLKLAITRDAVREVLKRSCDDAPYVEWRDYKLVFAKFASLHFLFAMETDSNEFFALELVDFFVDCLDKFFGSASELDVIYNFTYVYMILDEIILDGHVCETGVQAAIQRIVTAHRTIEETEGDEAFQL